MDYAYLAGIIDGEGTITLSPAMGGARRFPCVTVSTTTPELTDWLKSRFGGVVSHRRARVSGHSDAFVWKITHRAAVTILGQIAPHLIINEKRRRAHMILAEYADVPRNGKYTPAQAARRELFESTFFNRQCHSS